MNIRSNDDATNSYSTKYHWDTGSFGTNIDEYICGTSIRNKAIL